MGRRLMGRRLIPLCAVGLTDWRPQCHIHGYAVNHMKDRARARESKLALGNLGDVRIEIGKLV